MQDPVQVNIGPPRYVTKFSESKRTKTLKSDTIQYIPVENTLANLLQSAPDVVSEIMNFHGSPGGICVMDLYLEVTQCLRKTKRQYK